MGKQDFNDVFLCTKNSLRSLESGIKIDVAKSLKHYSITNRNHISKEIVNKLYVV